MMFFIIVIVTSCKTSEIVVEKPIYITDTILQKEYNKDSVFVDRYVKEYIKGDTFYLEKTEYKYVENKVYDTFVEYRDIPIEVKEIIEVEKKLNWFQKFLMYMGVGGIVVLCLFLYKKLFKKIGK